MSDSHGVAEFHWATKPNFGDAIAPLLLKRFAHLDSHWATPCDADVISVGSVLEFVPWGWHGFILGSGALRPDSRLNLYTRTATVLALRGPLSAQRVGIDPRDIVLGDPGLLVDELVPPITKRYDIGIVPHWTDNNLAHDGRFFGKFRTTVIHPGGDVLEVL